jgi:hypothetical protein
MRAVERRVDLDGVQPCGIPLKLGPVAWKAFDVCARDIPSSAADAMYRPRLFGPP